MAGWLCTLLHLTLYVCSNLTILCCCRWAVMLPASIQVCPIELPGRGRRRGEQGIATVDQLADALVDGLPLQASTRSGSVEGNKRISVGSL